MNKPFRILAVVTMCLLLASCAFNYPKLDAYEEEQSADVYLVPIGYVTPEYLISLGDYYEKTFNIKIGVTERLLFVESSWNRERRQLRSDSIIRQMRFQYWNHSLNQDAIYIGITHMGLYLPGGPSKFSFSYRTDRNFAVVSNNKMEGKAEWNHIDVTEVNSRFRKTLSKEIGIMHFGKYPSSNSRSILYDKAKTLFELDYINEQTLYSDILGQKSNKEMVSDLKVF